MDPRATVPVLDVSALVRGDDAREVAEGIGHACRAHGFFYVVGHGVPAETISRLEGMARAFFDRTEEEKLEIAMARGGRAWRGYFPVGGELTSGEPDMKEGLYFGAELGSDDPHVRAGTPLHGANLFPRAPAGMRDAVLDYISALTRLGHALARGLSSSLGLPVGAVEDAYTADPLVLFRIFNYPPPLDHASRSPRGPAWGVGKHTDYGLLTILHQDDAGGLEIERPDGWLAAPPIPGSFVCNIGDMLDRLTGGLYRSTPHRVKNTSGRPRLSMPFFFDPGWDREVRPLELGGLGHEPGDDRDRRWDGESVHAFRGTYGEYLLRKVSRVFPDLGTDVGL